MQYDLKVRGEFSNFKISITLPNAVILHELDFSTAGKGVSLGGFAGQVLPLIYQLSFALHGREEVACQRGCQDCCFQLVTISAPEALHLHDTLANLPEERRQQICDRFSRCMDEIDAATLRETLLHLADNLLEECDHYAVAERYFKQRIACPFLDDGCCLIYQNRFATCREYAVQTPASRCADPFAHEVQSLRLPLSFRDVLAAIASDLTRQPLELIPIPMALDWLEDQADVREQTWDADLLLRKFLPYLEVILGSAQVNREPAPQAVHHSFASCEGP